MAVGKLVWQGEIVGIQPRIKLTRSFDERSHTYLGYVLQVQGEIGEEEGLFLIGLGKAAQAKHQLQVGDVVSGRSVLVENPQKEPAEYYKTSALKVKQRAADRETILPPWHGVPPELEVYQERGHRRLSAHTYKSKCQSCIWGCRMAVEIIVDHWNPRQKRYRSETFCYGPLSCSHYKAGLTRKVPGRKGMVWEEENWIDAQETAHRKPDE